MNKTTASRTFDAVAALIISGLLLLCFFGCRPIQANTTPDPITIDDLRQDSAPPELLPLEVFEMRYSKAGASVEEKSPAGESKDTTYPEGYFSLSGENGASADLEQKGNYSPLTGMEEEDCWTEQNKMFCREIKNSCRFDESETTEQEACWRVFQVTRD